MTNVQILYSLTLGNFGDTTLPSKFDHVSRLSKTCFQFFQVSFFSFFSISRQDCFPFIKCSMAILMKTRKVSVLHNTRLAYVLCSTIQSESSLLSFHNVMCGTIYVDSVYRCRMQYGKL